MVFSIDQIEELKHLWLALDTSGDGILTVDELSNALRESGMTNRAIDKIALKVDENRDGEVSFDEFASALGHAADTDSTSDTAPELDEIRGIFNMFDQNGDGDISLSEMSMVLNAMGMTGMSTQETCFLLEAVDTDNSGTISLEEFEVVARYTQVLSEKKFAIYMSKIQLARLEKQHDKELEEMAAAGESGWALGSGADATRLKRKIEEQEEQMKNLTNNGGFGAVMNDFMERKAADDNGHESVASLFDYMPISDPHQLRETMQKSGRIVESLPDGFILGRIKQNKPDWAKTVNAQKPDSTTARFKRDRDLRAVFLHYCDKKSHGMSCKYFLKFARDIKALSTVDASRVQLCFSAATRQEFDRTANCKHDQSHLAFTQFKLAVIALVKCMSEPAELNESEVHAAVNEKVFLRAKKMKANDMDKARVDNYDVELLMNRHLWTLKLLYDHYSSLKNTTKPGAFCMTITDFSSFLRDFSLMGGSSPVCTKNLVDIFKRVKNLASDFEMQYISFPQFVESLARTALVLFPTGTAPSAELQANKATAYFDGETPQSINYVQRYLSRTNHFRSIQYSKRKKKTKKVKYDDERNQLNESEPAGSKSMLPRMPSRPSRRNKSKRRIRVVSRRVHLNQQMPTRKNEPKAFSSVHISLHEAQAGIKSVKLPAIMF